jgi:hypothetical protein
MYGAFSLADTMLALELHNAGEICTRMSDNKILGTKVCGNIHRMPKKRKFYGPIKKLVCNILLILYTICEQENIHNNRVSKGLPC